MIFSDASVVQVHSLPSVHLPRYCVIIYSFPGTHHSLTFFAIGNLLLETLHINEHPHPNPTYAQNNQKCKLRKTLLLQSPQTQWSNAICSLPQYYFIIIIKYDNFFFESNHIWYRGEVLLAESTLLAMFNLLVSTSEQTENHVWFI